MHRDTTLHRLIEVGIVAVVRSRDGGQLAEVARALAEGGVPAVEITMTVPGALDVLKQVHQTLGDRVLLGAGTVLDAETARMVLTCGAEFIVAPTVNVDVIKMAHRYDKLVCPGAFTPTEIITAWENGADLVTVFPAECLGPRFFKAIRRPMPQVRTMPMGGIDLSNAVDYLRAGASCLGIGSHLVDPKAVAAGDYDRIRDLARQFVQVVKQTRSAAKV